MSIPTHAVAPLDVASLDAQPLCECGCCGPSPATIRIKYHGVPRTSLYACGDIVALLCDTCFEAFRIKWERRLAAKHGRCAGCSRHFHDITDIVLAVVPL